MTMLDLLQAGSVVLPKLHFFVICFTESVSDVLFTLDANVKLNVSSEIRFSEYFVSYITICFEELQLLKLGQNKAM